MKGFIIDSRYYHNIQLIISIAVNRHSSKNILQSPYTEAAAILKGVKHRNELACSPNVEEITIRLNGNELKALKVAIEDLITEPCDDVSIDTLFLPREMQIESYIRPIDAVPAFVSPPAPCPTQKSHTPQNRPPFPVGGLIIFANPEFVGSGFLPKERPVGFCRR